MVCNPHYCYSERERKCLEKGNRITQCCSKPELVLPTPAGLIYPLMSVIESVQCEVSAFPSVYMQEHVVMR